MRTEGNVSKIAVCQKCNSFILACHVDYIDDLTQNEFDSLSDDGFEIIYETAEETRARNYGDYEKCKNKKCSRNKQN